LIFGAIGGDHTVDGLEPCEDWRPYVVAAIPKPVTVLPAPSARKTGLIRAAGPCARIRVREGGLDLLRRAA
jgi:hypothetical protein